MQTVKMKDLLGSVWTEVNAHPHVKAMEVHAESLWKTYQGYCDSMPMFYGLKLTKEQREMFRERDRLYNEYRKARYSYLDAFIAQAAKLGYNIKG